MLITGTFAYNESLQHQTIAVLLIKILIFFFWPRSSVHLFQSHQRFQAKNSWTETFRKSSQFNLSQAFLAKHAWLRSRHNSYSQFPRSPLGMPRTMIPFCVLNTRKTRYRLWVSLLRQTRLTNLGMAFSVTIFTVPKNEKIKRLK